jgi:GPH family glycoside/pentoside/hexuronide:cation symporter
VPWTTTRPCRRIEYRVGAIAVGIAFALLWRLPTERSESFYFWYFLAGSLLFLLAYVIAPWFRSVMQSERLFGGMVEGAAGLAVAVAVIVVAIGVLPALFLRERFEQVGTTETRPHPAGPVGCVLRTGIADFLRAARRRFAANFS